MSALRSVEFEFAFYGNWDSCKLTKKLLEMELILNDMLKAGNLGWSASRKVNHHEIVYNFVIRGCNNELVKRLVEFDEEEDEDE